MTGNPEIYEGLIYGVGPGTVSILAAVVVSMFMCLFKDSIEAPNVCVGAAIVLPIVVLIIVRALPVKSLSTDEEREDQLPTDAYLVRTATICAVIYAAALAMCLTLTCSSFITQLIGIRIDSQTLQVNSNSDKEKRVEMVKQAAAEESAQND